MDTDNLLSEEDRESIRQAISEAESKTTGEIRVHIDKSIESDPGTVAEETAAELNMRDTDNRNGVLFYIAIDDREFFVWGDEALNEKVPESYWSDVRDIVQEHFRNGNFKKGLVEGVRTVGEKLSELFPEKKDDPDELRNTISFGEGFDQ